MRVFVEDVLCRAGSSPPGLTAWSVAKAPADGPASRSTAARVMERPAPSVKDRSPPVIAIVGVLQGTPFPGLKEDAVASRIMQCTFCPFGNHVPQSEGPRAL